MYDHFQSRAYPVFIFLLLVFIDICFLLRLLRLTPSFAVGSLGLILLHTFVLCNDTSPSTAHSNDLVSMIWFVVPTWTQGEACQLVEVIIRALWILAAVHEIE